MRVNYSIGVDFAGGGIGNVAYYAAKEIYKSRALERVICQKNKQNFIPSEKIIELSWTKYLIRYPLRAIEKYLFTRFKSYYYIDLLYDIIAATKINKCSVFHYWRNQGHISAKRAKKFGAIVFVENASSHPLTQKKLLEEEYAKFGLTNFQAFSNKQLKRALAELDRADYVVVTRGFAYESFIKEGFPKEKLVPVYFGINLEKFKDFKRDKKDDKFRAIFVGQVTLRKGIQYLLQAWQELNLKDSELIVIGNICPDMEKIVKNYSTNHSIKFIGFDPDLKKHYQNSDVFIFPTIEEGSALVNYEAMAASLPIITTHNSGTIARNNKEGLIIPIRDVKSLKEKIMWVRTHPRESKILGKNARKLVEKFPWENYGQSIVSAYKKALDNPKK